MKKIVFFFLLMFTFIHMAGLAQKNPVVPKVVSDRLITLFPELRTDPIPVTWEKIGFNYRGTVEVKDAPGAAVIDSNGRVIQTERKINVRNLPPNAKKYLKEKYSDYLVTDLWTVATGKGVVTYRASVQIKVDHVFDKDGNDINAKKN